MEIKKIYCTEEGDANSCYSIMRIEGKYQYEEHWHLDDKQGKFVLDTCRYYWEGQIHREDGPALITFKADGSKGTESWIRHGKRHRENGPAWIDMVNPEKPIYQYYIEGKILSEEEFWDTYPKKKCNSCYQIGDG